MPSVHQINVSPGGVPKLPIPVAEITELGVVGDSQANRGVHGGRDKALCLFSLEVIEAMQAEGHPISPGSAGENITIAGLEWTRLSPGSKLEIGDVLLEITDYTAPCRANAQWFSDGDFTRMFQRRHPGESRLYARVLRGGLISKGDPVRLVD